VLYHGKWPASKELRKELENLLQDTLTEVHLAVGVGRGEMLRRNDCALIATVSGSKGLEFDAVVVIDPKGFWLAEPTALSETRKNALYVAVSRAKQGLSLILKDDAAVLDSETFKKLTDIVND
jgi:superfamily I DNA/RNA helicase